MNTLKQANKKVDCDHTHVSHAGASARHLGTALNVISMGISASSALHRVINFINKNTVGHLYTSISALTAPIFSIAGKASSVKAAEIRKDEIKEKISKSQEAISKIYTTILDKVNKTKTKTKRVDVYFPQFVKDAIKLALVTIGKDAEEKTKEKRSKSGINARAKKLLTPMKDRVYGAPFNVVTYLRHANGQAQNFTTETDLEQNRKGTKWDLDLSKIKAEIGLDKIESCNERLEAFLKQNSSSSEPENTGTLVAKESQELSSKDNPSTKVKKPTISGRFGVLSEDLGLWGGA